MEQEAGGQGSEVKEDVKAEDESGVELAFTNQGGQGDAETLKESGATEGGSEIEDVHGGGDSTFEEQSKDIVEKEDIGTDGDDDGVRKDRDGGASVQASSNPEKGDLQIEDELRMSRRGDDGDEVVSSKVTTVSFASEVQVLNEDELDEQWANANNGEDVSKEENNTEHISETGDIADENRADLEISAVPVGEDENERESAHVGEVPVVDDELQPEEEADVDALHTEQSDAIIENVSEETVANKVQPDEAVQPEQSHQDPAPSDPSDTSENVTEVSVVKDTTTTTEQNLAESQDHVQEEPTEQLEMELIPVAQLHEEEQEVPKTVEVVHRALACSAPEVTLEATLVESTDQTLSELVEPLEEDESAPVLKPEEAPMVDHVVEKQHVVNQEDGLDETVEATVPGEHTNEKDVELSEQDITGEDVICADGEEHHTESQEDIPIDNEDSTLQARDMDNHEELQADSALPDDQNLYNHGELYEELQDPSEAMAFESGPDMPSTHQEDGPLEANHLGFDHHGILPGNADPLPPIDPEVARIDVHHVPGGQRMEGLSPIELLSQANQVQEVHVLPAQLRSPYHQQHHRNSSKLESESRATSLSRIQLARIPSPPPHVKAQMSRDEERRASTRTSSRLPPSVMKMSSVMVNARKKAMKNRGASVYYEERQFHKIITLDEAINSRPPMPFDLDTPGPCRYSPRNQPLYEDNAPQYSFGTKFPERGGGGRTAYAKTWFNSDNNYTVKTRFERRWPSPNAYGTGRSMVGRRVPDKRDFPAFSMRGKTNFTINKKGSENEPGPDHYHRQKSDPLLFRRAPAFSMGAKLNRGRLFGAPEITPAPNYYNPHPNYTSQKVTYPAYTITGIRKPKSHALGPHATL